ncbi:multidrug resistance-associated 1-like, partial [Paramuricea clavata]
VFCNKTDDKHRLKLYEQHFGTKIAAKLIEFWCSMLCETSGKLQVLYKVLLILLSLVYHTLATQLRPLKRRKKIEPNNETRKACLKKPQFLISIFSVTFTLNDVLNDKSVDELLDVLELADKYDNATTFEISRKIMHVIKVKHNMNDSEDLAVTLQLSARTRTPCLSFTSAHTFVVKKEDYAETSSGGAVELISDEFWACDLSMSVHNLNKEKRCRNLKLQSRSFVIKPKLPSKTFTTPVLFYKMSTLRLCRNVTRTKRNSAKNRTKIYGHYCASIHTSELYTWKADFSHLLTRAANCLLHFPTQIFQALNSEKGIPNFVKIGDANFVATNACFKTITQYMLQYYSFKAETRVLSIYFIIHGVSKSVFFVANSTTNFKLFLCFFEKIFFEAVFSQFNSIHGQYRYFERLNFYSENEEKYKKMFGRAPRENLIRLGLNNLLGVPVTSLQQLATALANARSCCKRLLRTCNLTPDQAGIKIYNKHEAHVFGKSNRDLDSANRKRTGYGLKRWLNVKMNLRPLEYSAYKLARCGYTLRNGDLSLVPLDIFVSLHMHCDMPPSSFPFHSISARDQSDMCDKKRYQPVQTRILVTHHTRVLPDVDQIIVLKDGIITECGTYSELVSNEGAFSEFLKTYAVELENDDKDKSLVDGMLMDEHGSPLDFKRMVSVVTQQSEVTNEQDAAGQKQEPENKIIEDETMELGHVRFSVLLSYYVALGIGFSVFIFLSLILSTASLVSSQLWLAHWSSSNITDSSENTRFLGIYAGVGIGQAIFVTSSSFLMAYASYRASTALHEKLLVNIMHLALAFFEVTPTGRILNRFSKDIDMVDSVIPAVLQQFLGSSFNVLGVIFIISFTTPVFLAVLFPIALLYFVTQRFYIPSSRQLKRLESVSNSPIYSHFLETIGGVSTLRAYGQEKRFILESDSLVDHNQMSYFPNVSSNRWLGIRLEAIGNFIIFFTALFGVVGRDGIESGLVGLSITVALEVTQRLNWSVLMSSELEARIVAVERINEYSKVEREADWINEECRPPDAWPDKGVIEFERFDLRYRENLDLALRGIECEIKQGEKVGIVGRTGAGKSTMTMALFRVVESAGGRIVIDGIPISQLGVHDLRSRLTIIPQDPVVFTGTLRFNLDPFGQYSDEQLWKALDVTHLKTYVSNLEDGLQHAVSEGGANLSVGQRQLVCLARALLRRTKVLVLDEATAAVDLETDELIQQTIRKEFSDCTVLTIAHRLNTIMDYTRIMVLSSGHIIEFDSPKSLLEKQGAFYGMAKDAKLV